MKPETKPKRPTGYVLHRGTTTNGEAYAVTATLKTVNDKTGNMVQTWIMLEDKHPVEGVQSGIDAATVCSGCPFASGNGCYVNVGQAPASIWKAYHRGAYPTLTPANYHQVFGGRKVRFGAYGNPTLIPLAMVKAIAEMAKGWTGYFHDWKENPQADEYARYFMASTETEASRKLAEEKGYRYFHVSPFQPEGTIECLNNTHGLTCAQCGLCAGLTKARQKSVWIPPHGATSKKAAAAALA
jgi:hypothetical protein